MTDELELGEAGLADSMKRLEDRLNDRSLGDPRLALGEVLGWMYSLEEFHRGRLGDHRYYLVERATTADGQTLAALVWARGAFAHKLISPADLVMSLPPVVRTTRVGGGRRGGSVTMTTPGLWEYKWVPRSTIPPPQGASHGRDVYYDQHVDGQPFVPPLQAARRFLADIRNVT